MPNEFEIEIEQLLTQTDETQNLDYKGGFNWKKASNQVKGGLVKDILAMANIQDGGRILIGVDDKTHGPTGMEQEDIDSFEITDFNNYLHKYTDPKYSCKIQKGNYNGNNFVLIKIPEFENDPIICNKDLSFPENGNTKEILKKGAIYIRTTSAQSQVPSSTEMRELLGLALTKKRNEILSHIDHLIKGRPTSAPKSANNDYYKNEIAEGENLLQEKNYFPTKEPYWSILIYPENELANRLDLNKLNSILDKSCVITAYSFPFLNHTKFNYNNGITFVEKINHSSFGTIINQVICSQKYVFDYKGTAKKVDTKIYLFDILQKITQVYIFCSRFYDNLNPDTTLNIKISLNNTKNYGLNSDGYIQLFRSRLLCKTDKIQFETQIGLSELLANHETLAIEPIRKFLQMFNWDVPKLSDDCISSLQSISFR